MKDFSAHFRQLVDVELPKDSRIVIPRADEGLMILATWRRLPAEPFRPAKRSRMIRITVTQEALEDYAAGAMGRGSPATRDSSRGFETSSSPSIRVTTLR